MRQELLNDQHVKLLVVVLQSVVVALVVVAVVVMLIAVAVVAVGDAFVVEAVDHKCSSAFVVDAAAAVVADVAFVVEPSFVPHSSDLGEVLAVADFAACSNGVAIADDAVEIPACVAP